MNNLQSDSTPQPLILPSPNTDNLTLRRAIRDAVDARSVSALQNALRELLINNTHNIPEELKELPIWLCWKVTEISEKGKFNKIPYYPSGRRRVGEQGSNEDRANLETFYVALEAIRKNSNFAGLGVAMLPDFGLIAFDADRCVDDGAIRGDVSEWVDGTYAEFSPSGTGIRAFWCGTAKNGRNLEKGFELYSAKQFLTVTGDAIPNMYSLLGFSIEALDPKTRQSLEALCAPSKCREVVANSQSRTVQLAKAVSNDPILIRLNELGLVERDLTGGKFSILCPFEENHSDVGRSGGDGDTAYFSAHTGGYARGHFKCLHASCMTRTDGDFLQAIGFEDSLDVLNDLDGLPDIGNGDFLHDDPISQVLLQNPTQDNVALLFKHHLTGKLLYAHAFGCWYVQDGTRWRRDETRLAFDFARKISRQVNRDGKAHIASASFLRGVEEIARSDRAFAISGSEFNADHYMLNTPAGTFNLRTGTILAHSPDDMITLCTNVELSHERGETFLKFLEEITGGDAELSRFLKVSLGACLSGAVESHWLLFLTGTGRNGKNTLGDLICYVLDGYAKKIPSSTLMAKSYEGHPTELASLQGVRLAVSSEISDGDHWHESRINELTGDSTISARFMRGDFFEFKRTHKHLVYGNHRPQLRAVTPALKSRLKIVPFSQNFAGREDPELPEKLRTEAGYVLYWLLEGHAEWLALGRKLPSCQVVDAESENYFESQSTVETWMHERIVAIISDERPAHNCPKSSDLYRDYVQWKKERGEVPVSQTRWGDSMRRFYERANSNGVRYRGCSLKECDALSFD